VPLASGETANNREAAIGLSVTVDCFWPKMVLSPDARKMPPPTRPALTLSRATFASEKFAGFEVVEVSIAAAVEASPGDFKERDDEMASSVSVAFCVGNTPRDSLLKFDNLLSFGLELASTAVVGRTTPEGSKILIGTRRRAGTAGESKGAWTNDAGALDFCSSV